MKDLGGSGMNKKNERGQIVLGCLIAIVLLCGWAVLLYLCASGLIRGIEIENDLNTPSKLIPHKVLVDKSRLVITVACPSKLILSKDYECIAWASSPDKADMNQKITIENLTPSPLSLESKNSNQKVYVFKDDAVKSDKLAVFKYKYLNIESANHTVGIKFVVSLQTKKNEVVEFNVFVDSQSVRDKIIADRIWQIVGIVLGILLPLLIGVLL